MRARFVLVVLALATACTNDYGSFRFPKTTATVDVDARSATDAGSADGG